MHPEHTLRSVEGAGADASARSAQVRLPQMLVSWLSSEKVEDAGHHLALVLPMQGACAAKQGEWEGDC